MFQGRAEAVPGFSNAVGVFMSKLVPDFLLEKITENIYKSKLRKG
jgi:hypothetical protein